MTDERLISKLEELHMKGEAAYFKSKLHGRDAFLGSSAYAEYKYARKSACRTLNKANELNAEVQP